MSERYTPSMQDYIPHDMLYAHVDQLEQNWQQFAPDIPEAGQEYMRREFEAAASFLALCERGVHSLQLKHNDDGHARLYDYQPFTLRVEDSRWYDVRLALKYQVSNSKAGISGFMSIMRVVDRTASCIVRAQSGRGLMMAEGIVDMMRQPSEKVPEPVMNFLGLLRAETEESAAKFDYARQNQARYVDMLGSLATSSDFVNSIVQSWTDFTIFGRQSLQ